jgi:1-acyl-sn-glycerol-3-phosphate acyltransferase
MQSGVPELKDRPGERGGVVRTVLMGAFVVPWSAFWGVWCMVFGLLKRRAASRFAITTWARGVVAVAGIRTEVTGRAEDEPSPCLFFCNHQSALDIPILLAALMRTHDVRFMAKESLFRIPFFGWGIRATGFVPIRREQARHSAELFKDMVAAKESLAYSYILFPEGTRSPDGRLQPFKKGAFGLALRLGVPIVPVTLIDAARANPKRKLLVRPGTVHIVLHEPLRLDGTDRDQRDAIVERVYAAVLSALPEDQRPAGEQQRQ